MSRYDIADYLAIAVETVSRALTSLREGGAIKFDGVRCVQIRDRQSLERVCESPMNAMRTRTLSTRSPRGSESAVRARVSSAACTLNEILEEPR
jgi:DNA-binding transcriptional regulator YhcF (GntR family)